MLDGRRPRPWGPTPTDLLAWDLMLHDVQPAALTGPDERAAGQRAPRQPGQLLRRGRGAGRAQRRRTPVQPSSACSTTRRWARCPGRGPTATSCPAWCARAHAARGGSRRRAGPGPVDARPACRPTWPTPPTPTTPSATTPATPSRINGGPVVKVNASQRYASDADSAVPFLEAAEAGRRARAALRQPQRPALRLDHRAGDGGPAWGWPPSTSASRSWRCTPPGRPRAASTRTCSVGPWRRSSRPSG